MGVGVSISSFFRSVSLMGTSFCRSRIGFPSTIDFQGISHGFPQRISQGDFRRPTNPGRCAWWATTRVWATGILPRALSWKRSRSAGKIGKFFGKSHGSHGIETMGNPLGKAMGSAWKCHLNPGKCHITHRKCHINEALMGKNQLQMEV